MNKYHMNKLTPLEPWIGNKIGLLPGEALTRAALEKYQVHRLNETVDYVKQHSLFYRRHLADHNTPISFEGLTGLPFTTPVDIRENGQHFLCVSQSEIERVVTLQSSGTTAPSKRLYFTANDLELTVDFFHHGMGTMVQPGQKVLILMPGELPGSVGDLLARGLARLGVEGIIHGLVKNREETLRKIENRKIDCLVGLPIQLLGLARHPAAALLEPNRIKSILLSADYAPAAVVKMLTNTWSAPVFDHYGMTEMGLGGCVECWHCCGYHLREADLLIEIIDPLTGQRLPDGSVGEVVFTTLTRRGMPLIRYRTGDLARFLTEPCPCGTVLRRLERMRKRIAGAVKLANGELLNITEMDEALFPLPFLYNYQAVISNRNGHDVLTIGIETTGTDTAEYGDHVRNSLMTLPAIRAAVALGILRLDPAAPGTYTPSPTIKRTIIDQREEPQC